MTSAEFIKFIKERTNPVVGTDPLLTAKLYIEQLERLLFMPVGESHHNANLCPYCQENLNGKSNK